jgi:hypothetical protein
VKLEVTWRDVVEAVAVGIVPLVVVGPDGSHVKSGHACGRKGTDVPAAAPRLNLAAADALERSPISAARWKAPGKTACCCTPPKPVGFSAPWSSSMAAT